VGEARVPGPLWDDEEEVGCVEEPDDLDVTEGAPEPDEKEEDAEEVDERLKVAQATQLKEKGVVGSPFCSRVLPTPFACRQSAAEEEALAAEVRSRRPARQRGGRGSKAADIQIVSLNANVWSQGRLWMDRNVGSRTIVLGQEHRLLSGGCALARRCMAANGWVVGFAPAVSTVNGAETSRPQSRTSAGTFVAAANHVGIEPLHGSSEWDMSPPGCNGRLAAGWTSAAGGLLVVSVYFWHSEGWSARNQTLMQKLTEVVRACGCLWLIGGDMNMAPETFMGHPLYLQLKGLMVAPSAPTCTMGKAKVLDYFVVDPRLEHSIVSIEVLTNAHTSPHWPVKLTLRASAKDLVERIPVKPRALPRELSISCAPEPPQWPVIPHELASQEQSDEVWASIVGCTEEEILGRLGVVGPASDKFRGRGEPLRWIERPVRPARARNQPLASWQTTTWRWLARRTHELADLFDASQGIDSQGVMSVPKVGTLKRLAGVQKVMWGYAAETKHLGEQHQAVWAPRLKRLAHWRAPAPLLLARLRQWAVDAESMAAAGAKEDAAQSYAARKAVVEAGSEGSAKLLHRLSKPQPRWAPRATARQGQCSSPKDAADKEGQDWGRVWRVEDDAAQAKGMPWLSVDPSEDEPMEPLTVESLAKCSRSFKLATGVGSDDLHPRVWSQISAEGQAKVVDYLGKVEASSLWPSRARWLWYFLVPKATSGERPIGLMATLVRTWERLRRPVMLQWMNEQKRPYDWSCVGKTAESAVWQQLVAAEGLDLDDDCESAIVRGTVLLDLIKCFENIALAHVWLWGRHWGVPSRLLRVMCGVFAFQRRLVVEGSHSLPLQTCTAIVAGSTFSCAILHIVLIWPCDKLLTLFPSVGLAKYVDDVSLYMEGPCREVADVLPNATKALVDMLERGLEMPVSRDKGKGEVGKSIALASHGTLRKAMLHALGRIGVRFVANAPNLGVDVYGVGRKTPRTRTARMAKVRARAALLKGLKAQGGKVLKVAKTGLKPAVLYGVRALGLAKTHVHTLRKITSASIPGSHQGTKSTTLRLAMYGCEVWHECTAAPIDAWATAVWDGSVSAETLQRAWKRQQMVVGTRPRQSAVRGPAGACIQSMHRLGWKWPSYRCIVSREGLQMPLDEVCPRDVRAMAELDSDAALWAAWTSRPEYASLAPRPLVEPIVNFFRSKHGQRGQGAQAASTAVQGGMWTQERLYEHAMTTTPQCQLCDQAGTALHRLWKCPGLREHRAKCPRQWQHIAESAGGGDLLWTRGLVQDPCANRRFRPTLEDVSEERSDGCEGLFTGDTFTDGSMKSKFRRGGQCGWAGVSWTAGAATASMARWGPMPSQLPVQKRILRAELWALLEVLRVCCPPLTIHCDNATVVSGIERGRGWCCSARRPHADVWRHIWRLLEDIELGPSGVRIVKCKAHVTEQRRHAMTGQQQHVQKGNDEADIFAKLGADADAADRYVCMAVDAAAAKVKGALEYMVDLGNKAMVNHVWPDVTPPPPREERRQQRQAADGACARAKKKKRLLPKNGVVKVLAMIKETAPALVHGRPHGHQLMVTDRWVWCSICGKHAQHRPQGLLAECKRRIECSSYRTIRARLARGCHPKLAGFKYLADPVRLTAARWREMCGGEGAAGGGGDADPDAGPEAVGGEMPAA
jgi:hypothetical protein